MPDQTHQKTAATPAGSARVSPPADARETSSHRPLLDPTTTTSQEDYR